MFHAIQSAYGWSDEYILDLRIKRLVQIIHVLQRTLEIDTRIRRLEIEWQTKVLAAFIAHTVQDEKAAEKLIQAAEKLSLADDPDSEVSLPAADTSGERDARSLEEIMERGSVEQALSRNSQRKGPGPQRVFGQGQA